LRIPAVSTQPQRYGTFVGGTAQHNSTAVLQVHRNDGTMLQLARGFVCLAYYKTQEIIQSL
jgi:hypothetical protein